MGRLPAGLLHSMPTASSCLAPSRACRPARWSAHAAPAPA